MTDSVVERIARAIKKAGFAWKAANGGDDASFADVPEEVLARAAIAAMSGWEPIKNKPPEQTAGDVWADHGAGLRGRVADCIFFDGKWQCQPIPLDEWEPVPNVLAWRLKPDPPALSEPHTDGSGT